MRNLLGRLTYAMRWLNYKKSIQAKIFLAFNAVVLISLIIIGCLLYFNFTDNLKANTTKEVLDSLTNADKNLNVIFEDVDHLSSVIVTSKTNVIDELLSPNHEVSYDWFMESKHVDDFLQSLIAYNSYIKRIAVIGTNDKIYYSGLPYLDKTLVDHQAVETIMRAGGEKVFLKQSAEQTGMSDVVTVGRAIMYEHRIIGVAMIDVDFNVIKNAYDFKPFSGSNVYVVQPNGTFVYNSNSHFRQSTIDGTPLHQAFASGTGAASKPLTELNIGGIRNVLVRYHSGLTDWMTIVTIPEKSLFHGSVKLRNEIIEAAILVFLIVLLVSFALATQITKNLRRLRNTMLWVQEGNFSIKHRIAAQDEVGELYNVFHDMINRLKQLMEEERIKERQKREAELSALQAQIRPHFLYNTLNTIKYLASLTHARNIEEVSSSLIELLQGVLGNTREFVSIRDELDYVNSYITLQKYKYINQFELKIEVEPHLYECLIPKLILQPIIENSLLHGIGSKQTDGLIVIRMREIQRSLTIEIMDNGVGLSAGRITQITQKKADRDRRSFSGVGLYNVQERLRLLFGKPYGLHIRSKPGAYTAVELILPILDEEEQPDAQGAYRG